MVGLESFRWLFVYRFICVRFPDSQRSPKTKGEINIKRAFQPLCYGYYVSIFLSRLHDRIRVIYPHEKVSRHLLAYMQHTLLRMVDRCYLLWATRSKFFTSLGTVIIIKVTYPLKACWSLWFDISLWNLKTMRNIRSSMTFSRRNNVFTDCSKKVLVLVQSDLFHDSIGIYTWINIKVALFDA